MTVRATIFAAPNKRTKREQEETVGAAFAAAYEQCWQEHLALQPQGDDPPDLVFSTERSGSLGVELFEFEQFYDERAMDANIINAIYAECEQEGFRDEYLGVCVYVLLRADTFGAAERTRSRWEAQGLRAPGRTIAKEVVALLKASVPNREAIPTTVHGLQRPIDPVSFPALSTIAVHVGFHRCRPDDIRRSDGRAAPLVILSAGRHYSHADYVAEIESALARKIQALPWRVASDRKVLVGHDYPRAHYYEDWGRDWLEWATLAAARTCLRDHFDEFWTVTLGAVGRPVGELTATLVPF